MSCPCILFIVETYRYLEVLLNGHRKKKTTREPKYNKSRVESCGQTDRSRVEQKRGSQVTTFKSLTLIGKYNLFFFFGEEAQEEQG